MFRSQYDGSNRVTKNEYTVSPAWNGVFRDTRSYGYAYDDSDGSLASMTLPANGSYTYSYDGLKRLNTRALKLNNSAFINRSYSYLPGNGTNATTMLVSGVTNSRANGSNISSYTYGYDNVGNITSVSGSTVANYSYDNLGQLRTETYGGKTYTYTYDTAGNIVSVSDGTTTKNYVYGDSSWKDLLTSYNGGTINYDGIGNPTKWYDGTNFTWVNGRRLASAVNSSTGLNNSYTYDADGLRVTKTVNGVQHKYVWQGSQLVAEYYGGTELEFFYDESGAPYAFSYKANASATPVMYYYVTNLQGDVTNIVDASGNVLASYSYNAWGKVLTAAGAMAAINPIRYRGYYYDSDTELYYLLSRYYDPEICRFVNADSYASTGQGISGTNMFAYCGNNPVAFIDSTGNISWLVIMGAGFIALSSIIYKSKKSRAEASEKYNHSNVSVYERSNPPEKPGEINAEVYYPSDSISNINIKESINITSKYEQKAILDVIMDSKYYSEDVYGDSSFMQAQWAAHNVCYNIASSGNAGYKLMQILSGSSNPIESSRSLDLRSLNNLLRRQEILYTVISWVY